VSVSRQATVFFQEIWTRQQLAELGFGGRLLGGLHDWNRI
jgi:hypothetical protein